MTQTKLPAIINSDAALPVNRAEIAEQAKAYAEAAQADNTRRAYKGDWETFTAWCTVQGEQALPTSAGTVAAFLIATAGKIAVTTQRRRLAAIQHMHREAGHHLDLTVAGFQSVWSGIRRIHGRPPVKKKALLTPALRHAFEALPDALTGTRDRALLLVGFAGALRRTELAAAEVTPEGAAVWIEETSEGLTVRINHSKGDQEGEGQTVAIPFGVNPATCPVRAWRAWLTAAGITTGRAFRSINRHGQIGDSLSDKAVALIVKSTVVAGELANGVSEAEAVATSAAMNDVNSALIQRQLRHARFDTTSGYIQAADIYRKNAAAGVGL
jgi:integrase